ncbi:AAA family ATPase [Hymenobacter cheonanensis]|uniref:AAA family ATPase n=1 Tax=Hymenobacter sp. CA2-7 TaxID=3063993 RepID=UPI00272A9E88|nr:AAA family ATPase [Hymenobacter sp. CA2-7]
MYVEAVDIKNIRGLKSLAISFPKPAGWHVIIGDNGTGKSTLLRSVALALMGPGDAKALRIDFSDWLRRSCDSARISLTVRRDARYDGYAGRSRPLVQPFKANIEFVRENLSPALSYVELKGTGNGRISPSNYIWSQKDGWFAAGFGSFRRLHGGDTNLLKIYSSSSPKAAALFSLFNEDLALTEALSWLKENDYRWLKTIEESTVSRPGDSVLVSNLKILINTSGLLPHGAKFIKMGADGPLFQDANGAQVDVRQMSDGFRSVLSIAFELIRQLVLLYGEKEVFKRLLLEQPEIAVPGVVLIDEIDVHLHPTWQTHIGQWFTKHFPNIQFIVTTHSPLVCRAAENGSIYRLAAPGSNEKSGEVTGIERDRLIYGNILDAYATDAFGDDVEQSPEALDKLKRLASLNARFAFGQLSKEEEKEMWHLRKIFTTDAPAES